MEEERDDLKSKFENSLKLIDGNVEKIKQLIDQNRQLENKELLYIPKKYDKIDMALAMVLN